MHMEPSEDPFLLRIRLTEYSVEDTNLLTRSLVIISHSFPKARPFLRLCDLLIVLLVKCE